MNDRRNYDAPAPTVRRASVNIDGLPHMPGDHLDDMSQTQREIIVEGFFEGRNGADIAARLGISVNTCDTQRKTAFRTRRDPITTVADLSTEIDLPDSYGGVAEMSKRHAARQRRRASGKKENRSTSGRDRSNFEGDRSNSRGDAEKNERARDVSVVFPTKS